MAGTLKILGRIVRWLPSFTVVVVTVLAVANLQHIAHMLGSLLFSVALRLMPYVLMHALDIFALPLLAVAVFVFSLTLPRHGQ